ncbi:MAG: cardiolipin synthase [Pirellulaceae bacterium]|nr:MAG: cardiolipin synthase [Pirellulaceae bacterium]
MRSSAIVWWIDFWYLFLPLVNVAVAILASVHVVLRKEDPRAAIGWIGVIWLTPLLGSLLYYLFGINRIARRAARLRGGLVQPDRPYHPVMDEPLTAELRSRLGTLAELASLGHRVSNEPLTEGNHLQPLLGGDEAFPAMLQAIDQAAVSVTLCTYIFDYDRAGQAFAEALGRAHRRGVAVRVLIDDVGRRYSWPSAVKLLHQYEVPVACFLPTLQPWHFRYSNLRNHRKILVVDGKVAFTGGMNLREGNYADVAPEHAIQDVHFRVDGPVVHQLQSVFAIDWSFTTGELLEGGRWYGPISRGGETLCRCIADGPDEDIARLARLLHGAISVAHRSILIVTPYFVPEPPMIMALSVAALKGVRVDIVLPARNNLRLVQWATTATLASLLKAGCHVWLSPPPFDHSKITVVDGAWGMIGSANWDQRSLRLNFEVAVECYDRQFVDKLESIAHTKMQQSHPLTITQLEQLPLWQKVRNGFARLGSPYL